MNDLKNQNDISVHKKLVFKNKAIEEKQCREQMVASKLKERNATNINNKL